MKDKIFSKYNSSNYYKIYNTTNCNITDILERKMLLSHIIHHCNTKLYLIILNNYLKNKLDNLMFKNRH